MRMEKHETKRIVREGYAKVAKQSSSCCNPDVSCGCGSGSAHEVSKSIGYSDDDIKSVPEGANLGLGCGNPIALASLKEGEVVLDLGSGAGFDCFLAAQRVGPSGKVIGVDMTPEMLEKARYNAKEHNYTNVEFRQGEIENLPVDDNSVDVIISNCVINLSPDKEAVFKEAYRVLKPGGRVMVSDIVLNEELPKEILNSIDAYIGCVSGAIPREDYISMVKETGFKEVEIVDETYFPVDEVLESPAGKLIIKEAGVDPKKIDKLSVTSIKLQGFKPKV